jgi:acyl-CoA synthetase (AMP-forming)/AMP-acid ligase II
VTARANREDPAAPQHTQPEWAGWQAWSRDGWQLHLPGTTDPATLVSTLGEETIPALAAQSARRAGGRLAISVDGDGVTHAQLDADAARLQAWLAARIQPGDRVLLAAGSSLGFVRAYLGALRAGAIVVLASPGATEAELRHLTESSRPVLAFADPDPGPATRLPSGLPVISSAGLPAGPEKHDIAPYPGDTALLAYTSGTTGRPKGVPLTHAALATSIRAAMAAWRWTSDDVLVHALPLYHQHGLGGVHATLISGSSARLLATFRAGPLLAALDGATVLFAVPTIYQALTPTRIPAALRLAICGSAPLNPDIAERLAPSLGGLPLVRYGTTESGLDVSNPVADPRADTVGLPLPGVLCRLWSGAAEAALGADGEIQLRGPQVFGGYWQDPAATEAAFTADGWFRTGDIGRVDPATRHLVIRGRIKEMIISGGMNVYPREVELVLEEHPAVAEAAVAGLPHERWGEQVTAWVVPRPGHIFDERELIAHTRAALSAYKCPKRVFALDALPRNALGKVVRAALAGHPGER